MVQSPGDEARDQVCSGRMQSTDMFVKAAISIDNDMIITYD